MKGLDLGGDYPYELTNSSKIEYIDKQHYKIIKRDMLADLPTNFEVIFDMEPLNASIVKVKRSTYLKIPDHNIPSDLYLQLGKNFKGEYIIQKL